MGHIRLLVQGQGVDRSCASWILVWIAWWEDQDHGVSGPWSLSHGHYQLHNQSMGICSIWGYLN